MIARSKKIRVKANSKTFFFENQIVSAIQRRDELYKTFSALENANTFKRFCSKLAGDLQIKLSRTPNKFTIETTKNYPKTCNISKVFDVSSVSEEYLKNILLTLGTSKATGINQIPTKFQRDGADALVLPLGNIINLSIKLSTFAEECKITKLKTIFNKKCKD